MRTCSSMTSWRCAWPSRPWPSAFRWSGPRQADPGPGESPHRLLEANEKQDGLQLIMLDEQFHTKIIEYTNNPLLININKQLLECFRVYRSSSFMNNAVHQNAVGPSRILLCFQTHNVSQAVEEMRRHLRSQRWI